MLFLRLVIVNKVSHQLVLNLGIVVGGLERARKVLRNFDRKRVCILPFFEMLIIVFLEEVLHAIEGITSCEFGAVGRTSLKPLTPLLTYMITQLP